MRKYQTQVEGYSTNCLITPQSCQGHEKQEKRKEKLTEQRRLAPGTEKDKGKTGEI